MRPGGNAYTLNATEESGEIHSGQQNFQAGAAASRRVPGAPKPKQRNDFGPRTVAATSQAQLVQTSGHQPVVAVATRRVPGAPNPVARRVSGAPTLATKTTTPFMGVSNSTESKVAKPVADSLQEPIVVKRRVPGAPTPLKTVNVEALGGGPGKSFGQVMAERSAAQKAQKFSVYSIAEKNLEEYKRRQDEKDGITRPKATGWKRVKQRVEWKSGVHCAICMDTNRPVTGRLKPCGHRSMCVKCYEEYVEEGRGVNCPECFRDVKKLLPDNVPSPRMGESSDSDGASTESWTKEYDRHSSDEEEEGAKLDYDAALEHLELNLAGKRLGRDPSTCGTGSIECGQSFGTGVGMALVSFAYTNIYLACICMAGLVSVLAHVRGIRKHSRPDSYFAETTLGNCGVSSCNVEVKWFAVLVDTAATGLLLVALVWERTKLYVYAHHIGDRITIIAEKCIMVSNLSANTSLREAKSHFSRFGLVERIEFINDLDGKSLALMFERREVATNLRIVEAKAEFGDTASLCSGNCFSEQDWGELAKPGLERKLRYIEGNLEVLVEHMPKRKSAFVMYKNKRARDEALMQLRKYGSGGWLGSLFSLSGFRMQGLGNYGIVTCHPGLYPSNILYHNVSVSDYQRYGYRALAIFMIFFITLSTTAIYVSTFLKQPMEASILLYVSNVILGFVIRKSVKRERRYLLSETNDATCKLTYFGLLFNCLYMMLYTALYSSRDGGFATFDHIFHPNWYDNGGGEIAHYYLVWDALMEPLLMLAYAAARSCSRTSIRKTATSQEQLNRAHNGVKLDVCLEHAKAHVGPTIAVLFCFGMPLTVLFAWVGCCFKTLTIRYVLFFHARVPMWRDGASIYFDLSCMKGAVVAHFFVTWAMCASADATEFETNQVPRSVGIYVFPILGFLGSVTLLLFASAVAPCVKKCLSRTATIIAPVEEDDTRLKLGEDHEEGMVEPIDWDAEIQEMQKTAHEAFDADFIINPTLYISFDPCDHPIFGHELKMRRSLSKARQDGNSKEELARQRKEAHDEKRQRDKELLARQKLQAEEAKARLHAYVESMTRKKNDDLEKMRKRAEAKKKRKGQQKTKRVRAKRLYEMDRDGSNFIV